MKDLLGERYVELVFLDQEEINENASNGTRIPTAFLVQMDCSVWPGLVSFIRSVGPDMVCSAESHKKQGATYA